MTLLGDLCHRTVVLCLSVCLSVTLVYSGQTVGWIKMSLGTEVGLGSDDIMLDGDPASPIERGTVAPTFQSTALARSPISATAEFFVGDVGLMVRVTLLNYTLDLEHC